MSSIPTIISEGLPIAERGAAEGINLNMHFLVKCVERFSEALQLFDFAMSERTPYAKGVERSASASDKNGLMFAWATIAAKSAMITIYEFHRVEQAIDKLIAQCPNFKSMIDLEARKAAAKLFTNSFPDFADIRTVAAHGLEIYDSPDKRDQHSAGAVNLDGFHSAGGLITEMLRGREYINTFEGKVTKCSISEATLEALEIVLAARIEMIVEAAKTTKALYVAQLR
jgi:hypothetical protein